MFYELPAILNRRFSFFFRLQFLKSGVRLHDLCVFFLMISGSSGRLVNFTVTQRFLLKQPVFPDQISIKDGPFFQTIFRFLNDTHMEELDSVQELNEIQGWLLLTFSICLTINSVILILLPYRCLKNIIHQVGSKNEWLLLSLNVTAKRAGFSLNI